MSVNDILFRRAQKLFDAGQEQDAQYILINLVTEQPENPTYLVLYQRTLSDPEKRKPILERIIRLDPENQEAKADLAQLSQEPLKIGADELATTSPSSVENNQRRTQHENYQLTIIALVTALITTFIGFTVLMATEFNARDENFQELLAENAGLTEAYNTLDITYQKLNQQYNEQSEQLNTLITEHETLNRSYANLQQEFDSVKSELAQLSRRYNNLVSQYNDLNGRYTSLQQDHNNLTTTYNTLQYNHTNLQQQYNYLKAIALEPPFIHVTGERTIELVFYRSNGRLDSWTVPFELLEQDVIRGNKDRHNIIKSMFQNIKLEGRDGSINYVTNFRSFVDPSPFVNVISNVYAESSSEEAFVEELWFITTQLTNYNSEMEETPRYPLETFLAGGGDCEDTAILLASMLKAAPTNWKVSLFYMDSKSPNWFLTPNHVIVYLSTDTRDYYIETTNGSVMEPYQYNGPDGWFLDLDS